MKLLLINPPAFKSPRWDVERPFYPPLGLCYLASVLEKYHHRVRIIDADVLNYSFEEILRQAKIFQPDLIGIGSVTQRYGVAQELIAFLRQEGLAPIVIGGNHATRVKEKILQDIDVDYVMFGEAEFTLLDLVDALERKKPLGGIKGWIYRENDGSIKINPPREPLQNLDTIPFPARHLLPHLTTHYRNATRYKRLPMTHMVTSRGCLYRCSFCDHDRNVRYFSPGYVASEFEQLQEKWGIREIHFWDEIFMMTPKRAKELCQEFKARRLDITWSAYARLDIIARNPELVPLIKESGCWELAVGIESGNQEVLNFIKKDLTLAQIRQGISLLRKNKIFVRGLFMLGHPTETRKSMQETINFAKSLPLNSVQFNLNVPLPGTEQYPLAEQYGSFESAAYKDMSGHADMPVFIPKGLTKEELLEAQKRAYREFYRRTRVVFRNLPYLTSPDAVLKYSRQFLKMIIT